MGGTPKCYAKPCAGLGVHVHSGGDKLADFVRAKADEREPRWDKPIESSSVFTVG